MKIIYPATLHAIGLHRGCYAGSFSKPFKATFLRNTYNILLLRGKTIYLQEASSDYFQQFF